MLHPSVDARNGQGGKATPTTNLVGVQAAAYGGAAVAVRPSVPVRHAHVGQLAVAPTRPATAEGEPGG